MPCPIPVRFADCLPYGFGFLHPQPAVFPAGARGWPISKHGRGEAARHQFLPAADVHGEPDGVFLFADVSGPRVSAEQIPRFGIDGLHVLAERRRKRVQEMIRQKLHVAAPGGKLRDTQGKRIDPAMQAMPGYILSTASSRLRLIAAMARVLPPDALFVHAGGLSSG